MDTKGVLSPSLYGTANLGSVFFWSVYPHIKFFSCAVCLFLLTSHHPVDSYWNVTSIVSGITLLNLHWRDRQTGKTTFLRLGQTCLSSQPPIHILGPYFQHTYVTFCMIYVQMMCNYINDWCVSSFPLILPMALFTINDSNVCVVCMSGLTEVIEQWALGHWGALNFAKPKMDPDRLTRLVQWSNQMILVNMIGSGLCIIAA